MSAPAKATKRRSWLGLLIPALLVFAVLITLGTWQIERKAWKEGLIAALTERLSAPPAALPPPATWPRLDPAREEYRRVTFAATFDHSKEALIYAAASAFRPDVRRQASACLAARSAQHGQSARTVSALDHDQRCTAN